MADTPNEKPEATTPTASAEDNPIVEDKAGIDGELTPKDDAKTEDDAPKNTEDGKSQSITSRALCAFSGSHVYASAIKMELTCLISSGCSHPISKFALTLIRTRI